MSSSPNKKPYRDIPSDEFVDDDDEEVGGGENNGRATINSTTRNYESVPHDDPLGNDNNNHDDVWNIQQDEMMRRRRRLARVPPDQDSGGVRCAWCLVSLVLIVVTIGLVYWKGVTKSHGSSSSVAAVDLKHLFGKIHSHVYNDTTHHHSTEARVNPDIQSSQHLFSTVHYDPQAALHSYNPFDLTVQEQQSAVMAVMPPQLQTSDDDQDASVNLGLLMQPNLVQNQLVFVTEGDLYLTTTKDNTDSPSSHYLPAMKLTTTIGNVRTPVINPVFRYLVAFTATYTGRREVYVMDLRPTHRHLPATRLTYWPTGSVVCVVGWKKNGLSLIFGATNREVGFRDARLYTLTLAQPPQDEKQQQQSPSLQILQIQPIPLSQALEGSYDDDNDCLYFVRFAQSSRTIRYVGGTAESLWMTCPNQDTATELTPNYKGTSKAPQVVKLKNGKKILLFLSDRFKDNDNGDWIPADMNLFAMNLDNDNKSSTTQLTHVSCLHNGMSLKEYSVDAASGNIVLRIGADLYWMTASELESKLGNNNGNDEHVRLPIVVYSDFSQHQERLLSVEIPQHLRSTDVFETAHGSTSILLGLRGQLWVAPVLTDKAQEEAYQGAGMNLPPRRYRVVPGSTTGGMVRVLVASHVPLWQEVAKSGRRLALVLATDPKSPTAEHGFYLMETQSDSLPSFVDVNDLPTPFVGGHVNGGPVADGGLGSVDDMTVTVSPCGRRFAWADKDGRICVMTIPLYSSGGATTESFKVLPDKNENGEPMSGVEAELEWSPGGRYLAVTHNARNQFRIISIVDCGDPDAGQDEVADIQIGRIVQATPDRFNSGDVYWGKTTLDIALEAQSSTMAELLGDDEQVVQGATTLYFLSDRDIITDVHSPWGTRSPAPHFPKRFSVYALPLIDDSLRQNALNPRKGVYGGGGASELWVDDMIALNVELEALADAKKSGDGKGRRLIQKKQDLAAAIARNQRRQRQLDEEQPDVIPADPALDDPNDSMDPTLAPSSNGDDGEEGDQATAAPTSGGKGEEQATSAPTSSPTATPSEAATSASELKPENKKKAPTTAVKDSNTTTAEPKSANALKSVFPKDAEISFGNDKASNLDFARRAYRIAGIPPGKYQTIVCQADEGSLVLVQDAPSGGIALKIFSAAEFPSDKLEPMDVDIAGHTLVGVSLSTTRKHLVLIYTVGTSGAIKVIPNTAEGLGSLISDTDFVKNIADTMGMSISVWPSLEYEQMYSDAWRMLRDYFYDTGMNGVDWPEIYKRYKPLVKRCAKREELDDVLAQMAAELSALHVFVYGGEYPSPLHNDKQLDSLHEIASLGATLDRSAEWKGYVVSSLAERDPDFNLLDGKPVYSPLSNQVLQLSGQRGLQVGDVIVGINGESVLRVPDIHLLLRGMAGQSVRLDVLRIASGSSNNAINEQQRRRRAHSGDDDDDDDAIDEEDHDHEDGHDDEEGKGGHPQDKDGTAKHVDENDKDGIDTKSAAATTTNKEMIPEPLITVPLSRSDAETLLYQAWEFQTRQLATSLAAAKGNFTVGYLHLQSMEQKDADAFVRGFYPNYNKDALIVDVRHNHGGNIDSWLLDVLQRRAWMYWQGRATNIANGGLGWDEQFAFRGHLVVLVDEHSASDGEGFARGVAELGLGILIGMRTWGGGIWLSSDNHLVDGGIATAPEIGTYNDNFGWGLGIEQMGVEPDVQVDNNPRRTYDGQDEQLERAIDYLADWLKREPIVWPKEPGPKKDMSLPKQAKQNCPA